MKSVFLAWDDGDYYGPDFIGCFATLDDAKAAVENEANHYFAYNGEWEEHTDNSWTLGYYHVDEVRPTTDVKRNPPPPPRFLPKPGSFAARMVEVGAALVDLWKAYITKELATPPAFYKLLGSGEKKE